jgi:hypothetical protein
LEAPVEVAVAATLTQLSERGYSAHFVVDSDGAVCCPVCGVCAAPEQVRVQDVRRVVDDHDDDALVLAIHCDVCRARGAVVAWSGPTARLGDSTLRAAFDGPR